MMVIRDAVDGDVEAITAILNALLDTTTIEYRTEPHAVGERRVWLAERQASGDPVLVADDGGAVVGFASYAPFRDNRKWPGYRFTVEHSVHVAEAAWGTGVGRRLMDELIARAASAGLHAMVGAVDSAKRRFGPVPRAARLRRGGPAPRGRLEARSVARCRVHGPPLLIRRRRP